MKKIYTFFLFFALSTAFVTAQDSKTKKADQHYDRLEYTDAAEAYQKLLKKGEGSTYVYERLGNSYYFINDTKKAETYYKRVVKTKDVDPETVYNYAQTLKANGKFGEYNTWMKTFADMKPADSRAVAFMENPNYLPEIIDENAQKFTAVNLDQINSKFSDYGGFLLGNDFYFASARNTSRKTHGLNEEPFLDIYKASKVAETIKNANLLGGEINTKYHEGTVTITADGKRMYFDRNDYFEGEYEKNSEGINQINLYYAEFLNGEWKGVRPAPFNSSEFSTGHPALSPDGKTLYFYSDRPGGKGKSDIYKVEIVNDSTFGAPQRLGDNINTEGREGFPFVDSNGSLYFSSDAHLGMGGLDVFKAEANGSGFGTAKNMGLGINSSDDDFAFSFDPVTQQGFVSSNRKGGKGSDDIYQIKKIESCEVIIDVLVVDATTNEPISGTRIDMYDGRGNKLNSKMTGAEGKTSFSAACNQEHVLQGVISGYESNSVTIEASKDGRKTATLNLRPIDEIVVGDQVVLNPILFDFDKYNIKPQAAFELDKLVDIMKKHPEMVISVEGHTDNRGSDAYNLDLSDKRARVAVQYVISKGIDKARISGKGFGESRPVADCGANCTEEQHQQNRRSEFIIQK